MLTKENSKLIIELSKKISESYPISELAKKTQKKSYSWVFNLIKKYQKEDVIVIEKRGKINFCKLNLENPLTFNYLAIAESFNFKNRKLPFKEIEKVFNLIPISYFTLLITGSYAKGNATSKSDLDIVVIVDDKINEKEISNILLQKGELMIPKVHPYVFRKSDFLEMLLNKEVNYGKLMVKNKIIVFGAENYYLILKEAVENGFKS